MGESSGRRTDPGAIVGGFGPEVPPVAGRETGFGGLQIKATPLMLNGILYFATPDNAWAVDARTGHEPLALLLEDDGRHSYRRIAASGSSRTGCSSRRLTTISVSLDARTGKETLACP